MPKVFDRYGVIKGGIGTIDASQIVSGIISPSRLGTGATGGTTRFLREDSTYAEPAGTGGGGSAWDFDGGDPSSSYSVGDLDLDEGSP